MPGLFPFNHFLSSALKPVFADTVDLFLSWGGGELSDSMTVWGIYLSVEAKCAVSEVSVMTGAAGSPWQSDLKLALCSAILSSEVTGESQCTLQLPLRPAFSAWQTTGADGAKCNALNKMNQSRVTWLQMKTQILPADIQKPLFLRITLFVWCKNIVSESLEGMKKSEM